MPLLLLYEISIWHRLATARSAQGGRGGGGRGDEVERSEYARTAASADPPDHTRRLSLRSTGRSTCSTCNGSATIPTAFDRALARRGLAPAARDDPRARRAAPRGETRLQEKQASRNALSKQIGIGQGDAARTPRAAGRVDALKDAHRRPPRRRCGRAGRARRACSPACPTSSPPTCPTAPTRAPTSCCAAGGDAAPTSTSSPRQHDELGEALG